MCGIAGYLSPATDARALASAVLSAMTAAIRHRGPDDGGIWHDENAGVGLGMRRLAIIDLSPAGAQPMMSAGGRYVLVFNGEVYNHKELRTRLDEEGRAPNWRGHSDTEVLMAAIDAWGLTQALQATNGMFGLGLWDREQRTLSLACDRFGEKPVYYGRSGRAFLFGSELKSLGAHPDWSGEIDREALTLFTQFSYVPAPYSIYRNIRKLEPGTMVSVSAAGLSSGAEPAVTHYWSAHEMVEASLRNPFVNGEATKEFERIFRSTVALRMEADVPLGAFLSGGFDSTAVVAMMQELSPRPVRTFSIGFNEPGYDEAPFASAVAQHLQTEHTQLYVTAKQAMEVIPRLPSLYDEPFADSSQLPTFLVAELARRHVTVALSGDGGDELFGGYLRYVVANRIGRTAAFVPEWLRNSAAHAIRKVGAERWDLLYGASTAGRGRRLIGDRALKFADFLASNTPLQGYERMVTAWPRNSDVVTGGKSGYSLPAPPACLDPVEAMMFCDLVTYLPGDILTKVDRATMGVSLEGRMPFLDHRLAEFAWRLPLKEKVAGGQGKRVVREFVYSRVPKRLMDRPKTGFGAPVGDWLRGPLRDWAESLLENNRISAEGYFDAPTVSACWRQHLSGRNESVRLWPLLMFQAWLSATTQPSPQRFAPYRSAT